MHWFRYRIARQSLCYTGLVILSGLTFIGCSPARTQGESSELPIKAVGWIEEAQILGVESPTEAKLDTGATTTSINAEILDKPEDTSEAGGMIRFRFVDNSGVTQIFEHPVVRWVKIKDGDGGFYRRPVIKMQLCLAGRWVEEEVNLADRDQFEYSVLVGRNMLGKANLVIDSNQTRTTPTDCPEREEQRNG